MFLVFHVCSHLFVMTTLVNGRMRPKASQHWVDGCLFYMDTLLNWPQYMLLK